MIRQEQVRPLKQCNRDTRYKETGQETALNTTRSFRFYGT